MHLTLPLKLFHFNSVDNLAIPPEAYFFFPPFFLILGSSGLSRLVSEKNSPRFTLIGIGNMWSLMKSIFSFEIAVISWAHISWPLHQAELIWKKKQQLVGY